MMLKITELTAGYGGVDVLRGVSVAIPAGAFVGLLGPNGAGKTTLIRSISGFTRINDGDILLDGETLMGRSPEAIVDSGVIHVPQGRMLFPELTVEENLQLGAYRSGARLRYHDSLKRVEAYFPILRRRWRQRAGVLSGGEQQMLAIGRALMACPVVLLLDEPSIGLAPRVIDDIFDVLSDINAEGVTIFLAEQNAMKVLLSASSAYIIENGVIVHEGASDELRNSEVVRRSYLGVS
jgi:branched-chain amino acid transport system ATP-binding protein